MSARLAAASAALLGRTRKDIQQQLSVFEKAGLKMTLDTRNASLTEMEMDVLDIMDDPLNSADFKLRALNRLIVVNLKFLALSDNPAMAKLIGAWHNAMSNWNIIVDTYASSAGTYAIVEREVVHVYEDGTVQIRKLNERLSPSDFQHQFFRYMADSDWQKEMKKRYARIDAEAKNWKPLTFTPLRESVELGERSEDDQRELARTQEDNEYFARVEMIPRGWKVYGWMHREKFSYPNTPIVLTSGPQMPGQQGGSIRPMSSGDGALPPDQSAMGATSRP